MGGRNLSVGLTLLCISPKGWQSLQNLTVRTVETPCPFKAGNSFIDAKPSGLHGCFRLAAVWLLNSATPLPASGEQAAHAGQQEYSPAQSRAIGMESFRIKAGDLLALLT